MQDTATEAQFQTALINLASATGWFVHHGRKVQNRAGRWETPIAGHPGFPDLVLVHSTRGLIVAELKSAGGRVGSGQQRWLDMLGDHVEVHVWRPADWDQIVKRLTQNTEENTAT